MFFEDIVKDLAVDVVEIRPLQFTSVDSAEHIERPDTPIGGELDEIDIRALLGGNSFDFVLNRPAPIENGSTYVPCEGLYVREVSHWVSGDDRFFVWTQFNA